MYLSKPDIIRCLDDGTDPPQATNTNFRTHRWAAQVATERTYEEAKLTDHDIAESLIDDVVGTVPIAWPP